MKNIRNLAHTTFDYSNTQYKACIPQSRTVEVSYCKLKPRHILAGTHFFSTTNFYLSKNYSSGLYESPK